MRPAESALMQQFHQAVTLAEHGEPQQAFSLTHSLLQAHPDFVPALKLQGSLLEDAGHNAEAMASYERAFEHAPNDPDLLYKLGVNALVTGHSDQAIAFLSHRSRLAPRDGDTLFYLAQAYHLNGKNDLALKTIRECLQLQPTNTAVWQKYGELLCSSGDPHTSLHWLLKAKNADPTLDRIDFDLAVANYDGMDLATAETYATRAVAAQPNSLTTLALLAAIKLKLSEWQDAKALYEQLLAAKSDDTSSLLGLGHCELELKNYQASVDALNRLLQLDPTQVLAHFFLSRAFSGLGRTADAQHEAALHTRMLEQISVSAPAGQTDRQKAIWDQAQKLLEANQEKEAIQLLEENFKTPTSPEANAYVLLGALQISMGRRDDATHSLNRALSLNPKARGANTDLGILALQQGDYNRAESYFTEELALDANYFLATAELGEVRYRQGRWSEAADLLAKSKTTIPALLYLLCDSYFRLGNISDANLTAETLAAYAQNDANVVQGLIDLLNRNHQTELAARLSPKS